MTVALDTGVSAVAINREHQACETTYQHALAHAFEAGRLLLEVKAELRHGEWLPWLQDNVEFSEKQAQRYMQLASHRAELEAANPTCVSDLGVAAALKQIAKPRETPVDVAGALQGLAGPSTDERTTTERLDQARERLRDDATVEWTMQQIRKRHRAIELLEAASEKIGAAAAGNLSTVAISELLRDGAIDARRAAAALEDLAFTFER